MLNVTPTRSSVAHDRDRRRFLTPITFSDAAPGPSLSKVDQKLVGPGSIILITHIVLPAEVIRTSHQVHPPGQHPLAPGDRPTATHQRAHRRPECRVEPLD